MILSELLKLFVLNNKEMSHRIMPIYRRGYRLLANNEIPVQPFEKQYMQKKSGQYLILSKNSLCRKMEYCCMRNISITKLFELKKDKEIKLISRQWLIGLLKLKSIDPTFKYKEFIKNSLQALYIVTEIIAGEEFSALEELLTAECLSEVKNNIAMLQPELRHMILCNEAEQKLNLLSDINVDSNLLKTGSKSEERIATIVLMCAYFTQADFKFGGYSYHLFKQYHTEFKRSYRNNIKGPWVISDMNIRCALVKL